ncbi:MAG: ribonuclease HI family protein [Actinomycetota bacterium]|nr:ribonuclease HI family protein [Actinomycetota bacterium]
MRLASRVFVIVPVFLLAIFLISLGVKLTTWGFGILIFAIGLGLILPQESVRATLYTGGVAHHTFGDPTGPAGVGAVLRSESGELLGEMGRSIGTETNSVADYTALIEGLEMALDKGVDEVNVFVDSPLIAGHLLKGYRVRADQLRPLVEHARQLLDQFPRWSLTRVPRKLNVEPDLLANRAIERAMVTVGMGS